MGSKKSILNVLIVFSTLSAIGCASRLMKEVPRMELKDPDHAVVTFIRSSIMAPTYNAELWDRETPIGELSLRSYIQYKAEPGHHLFLSKSEHWSYLEANLMTGEQYVVKLEVVPGGNAPRLIFKPLSPRRDDVDKEDIEEWLANLKSKKMIDAQKKEYITRRIHEVQEAIAFHDSGKTVFENLYAEDFWHAFSF